METFYIPVVREGAGDQFECQHTMSVLGFDIGGANLKAANSSGSCAARPFAIWKAPDALAAELRALESRLPGASEIAVTMTAELADCYATKAEGVARIIAAVQEVAETRPVHVWLTSGKFATPAEAIAQPLAAAASNWQALATWTARWAGRYPALLLDIGTTTTDLIPLDAGCPSTTGLTDATRLMAGELVYTGVRRTPVCAVAPAVPFQGSMCPLAGEWFATMLDVWLWLGEIPEDIDDTETANGRPATRCAAHDRLARQLCCDRTELDTESITVIARYLADRQVKQISTALEQVLINREPRQRAIVSGSGSFLAHRIVSQHQQLGTAEVVDLSVRLSRDLATAACAYAVAILLQTAR